MKANISAVIASATLIALGTLVMVTGVDKGDICRTVMGNAYYIGGCVVLLLGRK